MLNCLSATSLPDRMAVASLAGVFLLLGLAKSSAAPQPAGKAPAEKTRQIAITIVYDNNPFDEQLETSWGFACVVEGFSQTILFDTGGKGQLLLANMAKAGFQPGQIDSIVLSHAHGDHTGGMVDFLKANPKVKVFVPKAFAVRLSDDVIRSGAELVQTEGPVEVCEGVWTTGVLTRPLAEQGLCLDTSEGPVVITGCAHPGIARMARAARMRLERPVYAVLGGFHMGRASGEQMDTVIGHLRRLGVQKVAPTHCSGNNTRKAMKGAFADGYLPSGLGAKLVFHRADKP